MVIRFMKNPYFLTMASMLKRQKVLHRSLKCEVRYVCQKLSRSVYDKNRSHKRYKSDGDRYNASNEIVKENSKPATQTKELRDCHKSENSRLWPRSLIEEINKMLQIEDHHVISSKDITNVEWCPIFVKPDIRGHVRGGKDLPHHTCRECKRLCLHLLGRPGTLRLCLECSGKWEKKYIPLWYFHYGCKYCRKK